MLTEDACSSQECDNIKHYYMGPLKIQSFSELEIDAMCCVWPGEVGYLYIYRCCNYPGDDEIYMYKTSL